MKTFVQLFLKGTINNQPGLSRPGHFDQSSKSGKKGLSFTSLMDPSFLIRSVRQFFDLKPASNYKRSKIRRRANKSFEDFIFKGYDQQTPGLSRPGTFKDISRIYKN